MRSENELVLCPSCLGEGRVHPHRVPLFAECQLCKGRGKSERTIY